MRTLAGEYTGWAPRAVRTRALGQRVRAVLLYHAHNYGEPVGPRQVRWTYFVDRERYYADYPMPLPFGWRSRRAISRDGYEVGPWWYFVADDARDLYWRCYWWLAEWAYARGLVAFYGGSIYVRRVDWFPNQKWEA